MKYYTYEIIRNGYTIVKKTYNKPKTENQLRRLAVDYMVNRDISTKYPFTIYYRDEAMWEV